MMRSRHAKTLRTIPFLIAACFIGLPVNAQYSGGTGGTGEPNDPYQIATAADLIALGETPADYGKHFILTADIDLDPNLPGGKVFDKAVVASYPFGRSFSGVFDGKGHVIRHLTIMGGSHLGLFAELNYAHVRDLGFVDANIAGSGDYVGALAGYNEGYVTQCYSTGRVRGRNYIGGLVGYNDWGRVGKVVGCHSSTAVHGNTGVGGLVGENVCTVIDCYAGGSVSGTFGVGGLVGINGMEMGMGGPATGYVARCYSTGLVTGEDEVGGLVGLNWWGDVGERDPQVFRAEVACSFWDTESSGQATSAGGGIGLTTPEMHTGGTFLDAGWDFIGETVNGTEDIWKIAEGLGYPRLAWEKYSGGTGEPNDPYQIAAAADLIALGETPEDYDKHFILTADIDLDPNLPGRKVFDRAVIAPDTNDVSWWFEGTPFAGVFDGRGHTLRHLSIAGGSFLGLFGRLDPTASVSNLGLEAVAVSGTGWYIGGLVGSNNQGSIAASYSTGSVSGGSSVGGLAGEHSEGIITTSYSAAWVSGDGYIGGLVGFNSGSIVHGYSAGWVTGNWSVGGLVGDNYGDIAASFWDIDTSGRITSAGGTGLTTVEMQTAATFLDVGWDFVGETANGTEDIWKIAEGLDYPRLWWEPYDGRVTVVLGQIFTIALESNPSTGYRWEWVDHQDSIVEQMGEAQFKPRETGDPPLVGAGGWESFDFKAVHPGQMTLKLVYRRPWEEAVEPLKTFSLQVAVLQADLTL